MELILFLVLMRSLGRPTPQLPHNSVGLCVGWLWMSFSPISPFLDFSFWSRPKNGILPLLSQLRRAKCLWRVDEVHIADSKFIRTHALSMPVDIHNTSLLAVA